MTLALSCKSISIPRLLGRVDDQLELGPLLVFSEVIAFPRGGESALRANSELIEGDEAAGLIDSAEKVFLVLQFGTF
jgi:hypothetical protein